MGKKKTLKAGAIILSSIDKNKVALLYRSKENDWSFPKGHVEQGENATETMVREIKEETGLDVNLVRELPDLDYTHNGGEIITTKMFFVVSKDDTKLKLEFENDDIQWIQYDEVIDKLSYDNLKEYFTSILPIIESFVDNNKIGLAKEFASKKFSEANVQNHFLEVYGFLKEDFKVKDENILIAGLLHDVLEDTDTVEEEILEKFGIDVLRLVLEVSHSKNWKDSIRPEMTKQDLMAEYYEHIRKISDRAKLIKMADFTSHLRNFAKIYERGEQYLYPKFVNNDKYISSIRDFLASCKESTERDLVYDLTNKLEALL